MSQWAEIRHLHLVEGIAKREIARRLQLDIKTVRRAVDRPTPPVRVSPPRSSTGSFTTPPCWRPPVTASGSRPPHAVRHPRRHRR